MKIFSMKRGVVSAFAATTLLLSGCGNSENFVFTNTTIPVAPQPPVAVNDTVTALGNATLNQLAANGVLTNDTLNGASISAFDATTVNGGTVALAADGSFTYTPTFGFTGTDSFTYTLSNVDGNSTATVTLNVNNQGWFVDNSEAANGDGSQANPFNNLPDALAAAGSGDTVFVFTGTGTVNATGFNLPAGVNLVGQGQGLVVAQTIVSPGTAPTITGPITLGGQNTVSGFNIENQSGAGDTVSASGVSDLTLTNNTFRNGEDQHVDLANIGGTLTITGNTFQDADNGLEHLLLSQTDTNSTVNISGNTFTGEAGVDYAEAADVDLLGTSVTSFTFSNNTVSNAANTTGLDDGLDLRTFGTSSTTVTISGNTLNNLEFQALAIDPDGNATMTGNVDGNMADANGNGDAMEFDSSLAGPVLTISGNVVTNGAEDCMDIAAGDGDNEGDVAYMGRFIVENNNMSGAADDGLNISNFSGGAGAQLVVSLLNNTFGTNTDASAQCEIENAADSLCVVITGNTFARDVDFVDSTSGGNIDVEQFTEITTLNTFTPPAAPVEVNGNGNDVTSVAAGTCAGL